MNSLKISGYRWLECYEDFTAFVITALRMDVDALPSWPAAQPVEVIGQLIPDGALIHLRKATAKELREAKETYGLRLVSGQALKGSDWLHYFASPGAGIMRMT